ncbi:hypothetical protein NM208_g4077 [Fusarium decemcellulare]|uniref:Uncharacterized protein n=2 Tax=Fusarium decemcellulare TaxID=57161 RepID=A0ACC1SL61_9HYPO|nr:hypothetical protein NM208_g4304 [Fusarium decemcellulare]KAJ3542469.1 hypothetical protein NM208_g4077 [Fusarium decemcellulare]
MVNLEFVCSLAFAATTLAAPSGLFSSLLSSLESRAPKACTNPSNLIKNPSFESKSLSPWIYHPYYPKQASQKVVTPGYKSNHALQVTGFSKGPDDYSYSQMKQNFTTCKTTKYRLSWSMFLPKGAAQGIDPRFPSMVVWVTYPGAAAQVAYFNFGPNLFNGSTSSVPKTYNVNEWVNLTADLGTLRAGNCILDVNWSVSPPSKGDPTSVLRLKLDNFVIKALA